MSSSEWLHPDQLEVHLKNPNLNLMLLVDSVKDGGALWKDLQAIMSLKDYKFTDRLVYGRNRSYGQFVLPLPDCNRHHNCTTRLLFIKSGQIMHTFIPGGGDGRSLDEIIEDGLLNFLKLELAPKEQESQVHHLADKVDDGNGSLDCSFELKISPNTPPQSSDEEEIDFSETHSSQVVPENSTTIFICKSKKVLNDLDLRCHFGKFGKIFLTKIIHEKLRKDLKWKSGLIQYYKKSDCDQALKSKAMGVISRSDTDLHEMILKKADTGLRGVNDYSQQNNSNDPAGQKTLPKSPESSRAADSTAAAATENGDSGPKLVELLNDQMAEKLENFDQTFENPDKLDDAEISGKASGSKIYFLGSPQISRGFVILQGVDFPEIHTKNSQFLKIALRKSSTKPISRHLRNLPFWSSSCEFRLHTFIFYFDTVIYLASVENFSSTGLPFHIRSHFKHTLIITSKFS